jgi:hypothetical protein
MSSELSERLLAHFSGAEVLEARAFVSLIDFDTGLRYGLVTTEDGSGEHGRWAVASQGKVTLFESGGERAFVELVEHPRREVEAKIEAAATKLGLPPLDTTWSLPTIDLLRALMRAGSQHYARLALGWVLPSELRELRSDIQAVANNNSFPAGVRSLAERMIVAECNG